MFENSMLEAVKNDSIRSRIKQHALTFLRFAFRKCKNPQNKPSSPPPRKRKKKKKKEKEKEKRRPPPPPPSGILKAQWVGVWPLHPPLSH